MPYALIAIGVIMMVTGVQNTYSAMASQLQTDGVAFLKWMIAFGVIGGVGYVQDLQNLSRMFMTLMIIAVLLSNSKTGLGFFGNLQNAINAGPVPPGSGPTPITPTGPVSSAGAIY